jgi:DNA polymerase-3 subunit beta
MKLSIPKSEFQRGLSRIQAIVEKRNTMPILANVLLEATRDGKEGALTFVATDLEVGISGSHPAEVAKEGSVTVSAKKLYEIVRELPEEKVQLELSSNFYLTLRCARAEFTLAGTSGDEYPDRPELTPDRMAAVQGAVLGDMIARTMYAASLDETRYNLNGVYLERLPETDSIRMVATDGHRLACVDRRLGAVFEGLNAGVIIPRKGLAEIKRLVDEEDTDEVEIGFEGNHGVVRKGPVTLTMRLIEGEFPNYRQVIPDRSSHQLTVAAEVLGHALRRVVLLSAERGRAVKIDLADASLTLSANNPDLGEAREEIDVDYGGEPLSIAFNARYLLDALAAVGAKELRLEFQDALSPARLVPTDDPETLAVVMPMRV